jgi:hypothetical protein
LIAQASLEVLERFAKVKNGDGVNVQIRPEVYKLLWSWGEE